MPALQWSELYSVGIGSMNEEHHKLLDIINSLFAAMKAGQGKEVLSGVFSSLIDYTKVHFQHEEDLMQAHAYPGLAEQRAQHAELVRQVMDYQAQFEKGSLLVSVEVMDFLTDWLTHHILDSDKKYGKFLNEKGIR